MSTKRATPESYRKEVLKRNKKINTETVAAHEKLERELEKLGIEIKPSFQSGATVGTDPYRYSQPQRLRHRWR